MEIERIVDQLLVFGEDEPVPKKALDEAARQREAITPILLDALDWLIAHAQTDADYESAPDCSLALYGMFLLAQFGEGRAYPKLLRLLRTADLDTDEDTVMDDVVDCAGSLLYSTYQGDLPSAMALAADQACNPFARNAVMEMLSGLFRDGRISRADFTDFLRARFAAVGTGKREEAFAAMLTGIVADCDLFELMPDVREIYRRKRADADFLLGFPGFLDQLFAKTNPWQQVRKIDDAAAELRDWGCFVHAPDEEPTIREIMTWDVGRNEPCPCGSGKKFKHCCLKKLEAWQAEMRRPSEEDDYPAIDGADGRPGLSDYFDRDAIAVDEPAYRALTLLRRVPDDSPRDERRRAEKQAREWLWTAFQETLRICRDEGLATPADFDAAHQVHYACAEWLRPLADLLDGRDEARCREVRRFLNGEGLPPC